MNIRLGKAISELNIGLQTAVEFLEKKSELGEVKAEPTFKLNDAQYEALMKAFHKDKEVRNQAEKLFPKKTKEKKRVAEDNDHRAETVLNAGKQQYKPLGKIDLSNLGGKAGAKNSDVKTVQDDNKEEAKPAAVSEVSNTANDVAADKQEKVVNAEATKQNVVADEQKAEKQVDAPQEPKKDKAEAKAEHKERSAHAPKADAAKSAATVKAADEAQSVQSEKASKAEVANVETSAEGAATDGEGADAKSAIFTLKSEQNNAPGIKVMGKIDLSTINQNTRPKKKSKEEKRKERENKGQQGGERRKRSRINSERVDINAAANQPSNNKNKGGNTGGGGNNNAAGGRNANKKNKKPNRNQKPLEVNEEDVARQVKETLARLTNRNQNKKGAKYRKEKRDAALERLNEERAEERKESKTLKLTEFVTVSELASMMDISVNQVIGTLMSVGIMVSINQRLDAETINLVAEEFGFKTEYVSAEVSEAVTEEADDEADLVPRSPIVTFLDTPGHEAFTAMRARGAQVTDIAIIIIAADDSVMPTTKEAIAHAQAANVPMVFAINKIDKPGANPDKIREDLSQMNLLVEEWGGKYQCQEISAKKGVGVNELLEKVLLEAEMLDLKANPNRKGTGSIIESSLDKGRGYVSTLLVSNGTLHVGDNVIAGTSWGRIKAMFNERNQRIESAGPAEPAIILGLNGAPTAGDAFHVLETEQEARDIANKRLQLQREQGLRTQKRLTLSDISHRIALGSFKELNIIVKGDTDGSIEALSDSFIKLSTEKVKVNVIHKAVGQISENDVTLADASDALIVGFQVRPSAAARKLADQEGVEINTYSVIYDAIDDVHSAMEGMLDKVKKEVVTGQVEVREVYKISKVGTVAGAIVTEGKVHRVDKTRLVRDGIVVHTGEINALKRYKDDVKDVPTGFECGISIVNFNDIQVGDIIETFTVIEVEQKL